MEFLVVCYAIIQTVWKHHSLRSTDIRKFEKVAVKARKAELDLNLITIYRFEWLFYGFYSFNFIVLKITF